MKPFTVHEGIVAPLDRVNVDTDAIIPKQFLKRIERTGFEDFLFFDWRYIDGVKPNPDFVLNQPRYKGASILLAKNNFGCGSSREHAPWALSDFGFRAVLAPSFADIFHSNCFKNGMLPIVLPETTIRELFERTNATPGFQLTIDLQSQKISGPGGLLIPFQVDPFRRQCLLQGLDDIGLTLVKEPKIAAFERAHGIA